MNRKSWEKKIYIFLNKHLVWLISLANIFYIALLFFVSHMSLKSDVNVNPCTITVGIILFFPSSRPCAHRPAP